MLSQPPFKRKKIILLGTFIIFLSVIGISYALWNAYFVQKDVNELAATCFNIAFDEDKDFDVFTLQKAHPITEEQGLQLDPYKFTITNNCEDYASYEIHLEIDNESNLSNYNTVRIHLENESFLLSDKDVVAKTLTNAKTAFSLTTGYLEKNESKTFELRMWIDEDAGLDIINQTFLSQITLTASYLEEEKVPPTAGLELAVCENTITATGTATPSGDKSIEKYEFKLDKNEWTSNELVNSKEFTGLEKGKHTIQFRVTDSKGSTSEAIKTAEIKDPETINIYGRDIPITTCKNGLYAVTHTDATSMEEGWQQTEYRFAGVDYDKENNSTDYVHNYVNFNGETWRIIGLMNVQTANGIEQRVKIIKNERLLSNDEDDFSWNSINQNDWNQSSLMQMLNGDYYNSKSGIENCYQKDNTLTNCDFSANGIKVSSRKMIDENIIWNIGGGDTRSAKTFEMYSYERGTAYGAHSTSWPVQKEDGTYDTTIAKIGLMYPSDYGYAVGNSNRTTCIKDTNLKDYESCKADNWLYANYTEWLLTPTSSRSDFAYYLISSGELDHNDVITSNSIRPVVYLKSDVKIVNNENDGSYDRPYELELTE